MQGLIASINELSALSPILVPVAKLSLIILICLIAFIPASLISWIIHKAFKFPLERIVAYFLGLAHVSFRRSSRLKLVAQARLNKFYSDYNSVVPLDAPVQDISVHPLQKSINEFDDALNLAPSLAQDREAEKARLVKELHDSVDRLGGGISELESIDIPELELDKQHAIKKRAARSSMMIFAPILIAVIVVNTVLLNTFFDELLGGREVFDIPYSVVIALMFTLIETGIGVVFGYQEREAVSRNTNAGAWIIYAFGWAVIAGLAVVEWFLYLMIGTSSMEYDLGELGDILTSGEIFVLFAQGGWMSLLGPSIVLGLYIFGHKVSVAYYDFTQISDFERFKKDLDDRFDTFSAIQGGIAEASKTIQSILKNIREAQIRLNEEGPTSKENLELFKKALKSKLEEINHTISVVEKTEIPRPEIEAISLSKEDTVSLHRSNLLYLTMLISSLIVLTFVIPDEFKKITFGDAPALLSFLVSLMLNGLMVFFGLSVSSRVNVIQTTDNVIAKILIESASILNLAIGLLSLGIGLVLVWLIFGGASVMNAPIPFLMACLCLASSIVVGKKLLVSVSSWWCFFSTMFIHSKSAFFAISGVCMSFIGRAFSLISPLSEALSYPIRFIFRGV